MHFFDILVVSLIVELRLGAVLFVFILLDFSVPCWIIGNDAVQNLWTPFFSTRKGDMREFFQFGLGWRRHLEIW